MAEYLKYQHVEKLASDECDGLLIGNVYAFPKIDGTNSQVWFDENGFHFGSRTRELSYDSDNAGFMKIAAVDSNILSMAKRLSGLRIFGEWLVPHSLKAYKESAWRKFYVFDVYDPEKEIHLPYMEYKLICDEFNVEYINPIRILINPAVENCIECLKENKFLLPDDFDGVGEGIVFKNYAFKNKFGRQTWGKLVTSEFKEKHFKEVGAPLTKCADFIEQKIADSMLKKELCEKVLANIKNDTGWSSKMIPRLLNTVYYDFVREETWNLVKEHKNPKVDFKLLQRFIFDATKRLLSELF